MFPKQRTHNLLNFRVLSSLQRHSWLEQLVLWEACLKRRFAAGYIVFFLSALKQISSSNYWPTCYVQSLQEASRGTVFCSYFIASLQTFLTVTPNAIVKHRRIRIVASKVRITITSFLLFGAIWFAGTDPSKNKTLFFCCWSCLRLLTFCSMKFRVKYYPCFITWYIFSLATRTCKKVKML